MTKPFVVVKHGNTDYRLHEEDGTETGDTWDHNPEAWEVYSATVSVPNGGYCYRRENDLDDYLFSVTQ